MATVLKINRQVEKIVVPGGDGPDTVLEVSTDDKSVEATLHLVGNAMDRFAAAQSRLDAADGEEEAAQARDAMARLFKRTISAIVGKEGWEAILLHIGGGERADPRENVITLGEVFAALVTFIYERCTSKQLRDAGVYLSAEADAARPRKRGKGGKGGKAR